MFFQRSPNLYLYAKIILDDWKSVSVIKKKKNEPVKKQKNPKMKKNQTPEKEKIKKKKSKEMKN